MNPCRVVLFFASLAASFLASKSLAATSVVVPNSYVSLEGNANNISPFSVNTTARYQQVFASSQFTAAPAGGALITQIAFRPDWLGSDPGAFTIANIQLDLSTTEKAPHTLDGVFANNIGADNSVVFGPAALMLSTLDVGPSQGPKVFDIVIPLTTPFFYDPTRGNLMMDVRKFSATPGQLSQDPFDAVDGDSTTSRVYNNNVNDPNAFAAAGRDIGLVTQFTFVPEPSTGSLLFLALIALRRRGGQ